MKKLCLLTCLLLLSCSSNKVNENYVSATRDVVRAEGYAENIGDTALKAKPSWVKQVIVDYVNKLQLTLTSMDLNLGKLNRDNQALITQNENKTHELIDEHVKNKWFGWKTREIWYWVLGLSVAGGFLILLFSSWMPQGWLGSVIKTIIEFFVSIPSRLKWLWTPKPPSTGDTNA